uniref:Uncharacterized protein n=1 Tax=Kalanchoe fedtschenkoi TaxID=63787 RepID=A0A7N0R9L3_KALFE
MGRIEKWYSKIKKVLNPGSKLRIKSEIQKSGSDSRRKQHIYPSPSVPPTGFIEAENDDSHSQGAQFSEKAAAPKISLEITKHIGVSHYAGYSKDEAAAIQIQTAYRGYLARRTLQALRGLVRLKFLVQGQAVKRQATSTLHCMQALARVQSYVRSRRVQKLQMSKEDQALEKQRIQKSSQKHASFRNSEEWKDCVQSKQQDEANLKKKHEAAMRRERTLAYSSVHQQTWKNSPKRTSKATIADPDNPSLGWSWLERWMAGRPWEGEVARGEGLDSELTTRQEEISEVEATKEVPAPYKPKKLPKPPLNIRTATQKSPPNPAIAENPKTGNARASVRASNGSGIENSEKNKRHSFAGSSTRDYESSAGSKSPRNHVVLARSPSTRPWLQSPLGMEHNGNGTPPKKSRTVGQAERPTSHLAPRNSPRRHSAPPKVRNPTKPKQPG